MFQFFLKHFMLQRLVAPAFLSYKKLPWQIKNHKIIYKDMKEIRTMKIKKQLLNTLLILGSSFIGASIAYAEYGQPDSDYYTSVDYRDTINPEKPECRWELNQTIGSFISEREELRYFNKFLEALDLKESTDNDPDLDMTIIIPNDEQFQPGTRFDILSLLDDKEQLTNLIFNHISLERLTATVVGDGERLQTLTNLAGNTLDFQAGVSSMLRQSYFLNGKWFDYEGGICFTNGIAFPGGNVFNLIQP